MSTLSLNPAILLSPVSDGYIAYDTAANLLHELNPTAALLVELCNGSRSVDEILELSAPLLPPNSESAVRTWLQHACDQSVLVVNSDAKNKPRDMSAADLIQLSERLRDGGKVHAAYLCQQRATDLQPEDSTQLRELGELAHILGKREEARAAYETYLVLQPDDAEIQHLLTSLRDDAAPARVPNDCIRQLYERFSAFYESNMCDELAYEGPLHLRDVIDHAIGDRQELAVLDLGCGTGLAGNAMTERARRLVGVDLSPEMIEVARELNIYDELHVAEVTQWLGECSQQFDLIIACDTLIYFGDLEQVLAPAAQRLTENGVIAFSVERAETGIFQLTDNGRYVHHPSHVRTAANACGMKVCRQEEAFLRMEYGLEVTGLYVVVGR